ncbi:MAG TPA: SDR family NAD(P)-dependent oxidoreductase [Actinomycetota bacterium]|nr:SDR family NAD(P)-dependent oxidoreductase [Actinomycetota bacterium]
MEGDEVELSGRLGILTGASRGLGVELARALAAKGTSLALAARDEEGLKRTAGGLERYGIRTITVPTDVTKTDDLERLVARTNDELGPPDLLVNNAGIETIAPFATFDMDRIEAIIATNLTAAEKLTRLVIPGMIERRRGHVLNISSASAKSGVPYYSVYGSTKHGLVGFSWSLRTELASHGVGVSVLCPSFVSDTGMYADRSNNAKPPRSMATVTPQEVAAAAVRAIEKNKAEVVVARGITKIADVFYALSPELAMNVAKRMGVDAFLETTISED